MILTYKIRVSVLEQPYCTRHQTSIIVCFISCRRLKCNNQLHYRSPSLKKRNVEREYKPSKHLELWGRAQHYSHQHPVLLPPAANNALSNAIKQFYKQTAHEHCKSKTEKMFLYSLLNSFYQATGNLNSKSSSSSKETAHIFLRQ